MQSDYEPLSYEHHGHLRLERSAILCRTTNLPIVPIMLSEKWQIAREFVIVFPDRPGALPHALLTLQKGYTPYLGVQNQWKAAYIPGYLRLIPFKLAVMENGKGALMINPNDDSLSVEKGEPLFDNGKRSARAEQIARNLVAVHHDERRTQEAVASLEQHGLLHARNISNSQGESLGGLRMVDPDAFSQLDAKALTKLHQTGALELYYAQLASQVNLRLGVIKQERADNSAKSLDELFDDDDDLRFDFDS